MTRESRLSEGIYTDYSEEAKEDKLDSCDSVGRIDSWHVVHKNIEVQTTDDDSSRQEIVCFNIADSEDEWFGIRGGGILHDDTLLECRHGDMWKELQESSCAGFVSLRLLFASYVVIYADSRKCFENDCRDTQGPSATKCSTLGQDWQHTEKSSHNKEWEIYDSSDIEEQGFLQNSSKRDYEDIFNKECTSSASAVFSMSWQDLIKIIQRTNTHFLGYDTSDALDTSRFAIHLHEIRRRQIEQDVYWQKKSKLFLSSRKDIK